MGLFTGMFRGGPWFVPMRRPIMVVAPEPGPRARNAVEGRAGELDLPRLRRAQVRFRDGGDLGIILK